MYIIRILIMKIKCNDASGINIIFKLYVKYTFYLFFFISECIFSLRWWIVNEDNLQDCVLYGIWGQLSPELMLTQIFVWSLLYNYYAYFD